MSAAVISSTPLSVIVLACTLLVTGTKPVPAGKPGVSETTGSVKLRVQWNKHCIGDGHE
jgi:hypothetical protein